MKAEPASRTLIVGASLALAACACAGPGSEVAVTVTSPLAEHCELPAQAPNPSAGQREFSDYAWRLFVALNWPAKADERGVPDCEADFGGPGRTVWESYRTVEQLFLPGGRDPGPWDEGDMAMKSLRFVAKSPAELPVEDAIRQAVGGWLIDQRSNPTYYEIAVDQDSWDYVRSNGFYNADVLNRASEVDFPTGSLEIKAAWRIMDGADESRYHTVQAEVMTFDGQGNPTGRYERATIGLVGLHIVYKAAGFPQWIWATFEQEDNAPVQGQTGGSWSYFDPECSGRYCEPNRSPLSSGQPYGTPNQVTRLSPIRSETVDVNATWRGELAGTPFQHYQLVSPQWPADPNDPGNPQGTPTPGTVANTTMESYVQPTSSCMDCHSTARTPNDRIKTNYSFIFLFAKSPAEGGRR